MSINKDFNHSYWEIKHLFKSYDVIIIGAGIVGLSTAISIKKINKKINVLILERGLKPEGASSKNAGFACFGSAGELLDDLQKMDEKTVWETVEMRLNGLKLLRKRIGDKNMFYQPKGGYEVFYDLKKFEKCYQEVEYLNKKLKQNFNLNRCYSNVKTNNFGFQNVAGILKNQYEGQLDSGLMMQSLEELVRSYGVKTIYNCDVTAYNQLNNGVDLETNLGFFHSKKVVIATNGFAKQLVKNLDVEPARAQVLVTKKINNLKVKGTFHLDKGYYYFRDIDNRLLLGGGRNLDFKTETTNEFGLNNKIQTKLDELLKHVILPKVKFEVDYRWSGIMGVGKEKKPIIKVHSKDVIIAVRMGGMGIAIGSWVGKKAAELI
jgi:glycine/D-amino acid oxidase-like deaminating enzyme